MALPDISIHFTYSHGRKITLDHIFPQSGSTKEEVLHGSRTNSFFSQEDSMVSRLERLANIGRPSLGEVVRLDETLKHRQLSPTHEADANHPALDELTFGLGRGHSLVIL